jgi:hypothetical protein
MFPPRASQPMMPQRQPMMPPNPMMPGANAPRPGSSMDPMAAMLNGLGPMPTAAPPQPPGLPFGGSPMESDPGYNQDMDGSALMRALNVSVNGMGGGADPYSAGPMGAADLSGMGTADPNMGLEALLQLLALGQMGVGGSPGTSGLTPDPGMGGMMGF